MATRWINRDFSSRVNDILNNADVYHKKYYASERFTGPSLHFHKRALATGFDRWKEKVELTYAAVASWGMHRMGNNGSKMQPFERFKKSLNGFKLQIDNLRGIILPNLKGSDWDTLEKIFKGIEVMASGTSLIGNSKVLAHLLPNLVSPIDRAYTLFFLFGSNGFQNDLEYEWKLMRKIHEEFYHPISNNQNFQSKAKEWMEYMDNKYQWDTSLLKTIDNLVIGAVRTKSDGTELYQ